MATTIDGLLERVGASRGVQEKLASGGSIYIEPGLPYLLVYRKPPDRADPGTLRLVTSEASYLVARSADEVDESLVRGLAEAGSRRYGAYLVMELWSALEADSRCFTIFAPQGPAPETIEKLAEGLRALDELYPPLEVTVESIEDRSPPGLQPLISVEESWQTEVLTIGLEIPPIYRDPESGDLFPRFLRKLRREISRVLRQTLYEFIRVQTTSKVTNYLALGTRTVPDRVWEIDHGLCDIEHAFDLLLLTSPVNRDTAWEQFRSAGFERNPDLHYRLLPLDPDLMKRRLFALELESIEDPALADLFEDKRQELDTQFTMLRERGSPAFRYSSQRLYGTVDGALLATAQELLATVPRPRRRVGEWVDAAGFKRAAEAELSYYSREGLDLTDRVQIRRDIGGLMVSEGVLLIGEDLRLDPLRVEPLIHHEVGTHVLTYVNGLAQPLEQLSLGLASYDELQEGLAVLAEYLVGGLDRLRMRLLGARVVAARSVEDGAEFVDTFRLLTKEHGYTPAGAWHITLRAHAAGGFTRDLIYLRGLLNLMNLLREGTTELERLYIGKIAEKHIDVIEELRYRRVLRQPPLTPRLLASRDALERLDAVRRGISLTDMISREAA
jgi:uncharacterized protein (TIGR02421 family)